LHPARFEGQVGPIFVDVPGTGREIPMNQLRRGTVLAVSLILAGCGRGPASSDSAAVAAGLDSVYATFRRAYAEADVARLMDSVYAPDAFYLPPGAPVLEGQDQFREQFSSFLAPIAERGEPGPSISFEILDRRIDGNLATDIGIYTLRPPGGAETDAGSRGKFIVVWLRDAAGRWRIHADGYSAMPRG
jgi:uncharacterized protein (TIGR02246 family)